MCNLVINVNHLMCQNDKEKVFTMKNILKFLQTNFNMFVMSVLKDIQFK